MAAARPKRRASAKAKPLSAATDWEMASNECPTPHPLAAPHPHPELEEPSESASTSEPSAGKKRDRANISKASTEISAHVPTRLSTHTECREDGVLNFRHLTMKKDHEKRPIWVCPNGIILLETVSPIYKQAYDFLIAIAEPISRPAFVHEYKLTPFSLYAAVSVGLETETIINVLNRLSKVDVTPEICEFIRTNTMNYGKVKLVLQHNRYYIESPHLETLEFLLQDPTVQEGRVRRDAAEEEFLVTQQQRRVALSLPSVCDQDPSRAPEPAAEPPAADPTEDDDDVALVLNTADEGEEERLDLPTSGAHEVRSFEISPKSVEEIKKKFQRRLPMLEEYDFRNDTFNPNLQIDLKPSTTIRSYQEKALSKMFGNGRARSGIIVLPCGAGKTLVGITACCTVKKSCLVLCSNGLSVEQWKGQFRLWADVEDRFLSRFTSTCKDVVEVCGITITTYSMIAHQGKRSAQSAKIMEQIENREWGLLLLDEVHVVPAQVFRRVLSVVKCHCKLGLTATLVREDDRIDDLNFLIGPKLYEANWLDLQQAGHIATVQCSQINCPMTPQFYQEYLRSTPAKQKLFYTCNPNKILACQYLIAYHEARGDKILVFSDNIMCLRLYAERLKKYYIFGGTSQYEREKILNDFRKNASVNTIFISKVGDLAIDLPQATVVIQISSQFGSRRQEAQRLGRVLRPKQRRETSEFNAFFYTLVSTDTEEIYYAAKRQQFLVDQGYTFKIETGICDSLSDRGYFYSTLKEQEELLATVIRTADQDADDEKIADKDDISADIVARNKMVKSSKGKLIASTRQPTLASVSGGAHATYGEFTTAGPALQERHPLFRDRFRNQKRR
eukprot:gnl/Spiro4/825_TR455_c0_g1_i1.p1 gnl/Spiro4/825_TR455_c0_g1~~gnl/Spiro4/825_TR455_c0_g1_i1.p1  ORF type:complete len:845 (+),score=299.24 gnl/Spiro4/825_TR455_c0_g1_i1:87-2621(+)